MVIRKLSANVRNIIQSGVVISDATQCVLELVYNALDAETSSIAVRVNLNKFYIQVVDNGVGIAREDLKIVGERYMTSKCKDVNDLESYIYSYGYRGTALASIVDVAKRVEIQSRHSSTKDTYVKVIYRDGSSEISKSSVTRPSRGTTVTVTDLLFNLPVRRSRVKEVFDLDEILRQLEALAVFHNSTSISLRNDATGKVLFQTHRQNDQQLTLGKLFGLSTNRLLIPFSHSSSSAQVSGVVCRKLHTDKSLQLVYVNGRIIHKSRVHKLLIDLLQKYGQFWDRDRSSDDIIDVEGYVFIVKIQVPYQSFTLSRSNGTVRVEFRDKEEILKCVCRAVKKCLKNEENVNSSVVSRAESVPNVFFEKERQVFGPSQLTNAIRGQKVSRLRRETNEVLMTPVVGYQKYVDAFIRETSGDGSCLAENAPFYEIDDFGNHPFHDFIAWLTVKSEHDAGAKKVLAEFQKQKKKPHISLKQIRREKFEMQSKSMLEKILTVQKTGMLASQPISVSRRVVRETTTYVRTPVWPSWQKTIVDSGKILPQVSFSEFLTWFKLKAKNDEVARAMMNEFYAFKFRQSLSQVRVGRHEEASELFTNESCVRNTLNESYGSSVVRMCETTSHGNRVREASLNVESIQFSRFDRSLANDETLMVGPPDIESLPRLNGSSENSGSKAVPRSTPSSFIHTSVEVEERSEFHQDEDEQDRVETPVNRRGTGNSETSQEISPYETFSRRLTESANAKSSSPFIERRTSGNEHFQRNMQESNKPRMVGVGTSPNIVQENILNPSLTNRMENAIFNIPRCPPLKEVATSPFLPMTKDNIEQIRMINRSPQQQQGNDKELAQQQRTVWGPMNLFKEGPNSEINRQTRKAESHVSKSNPPQQQEDLNRKQQAISLWGPTNSFEEKAPNFESSRQKITAKSRVFQGNPKIPADSSQRTERDIGKNPCPLITEERTSAPPENIRQRGRGRTDKQSSPLITEERTSPPAPELEISRHTVTSRGLTHSPVPDERTSPIPQPEKRKPPQSPFLISMGTSPILIKNSSRKRRASVDSVQSPFFTTWGSHYQDSHKSVQTSFVFYQESAPKDTDENSQRELAVTDSRNQEHPVRKHQGVQVCAEMRDVTTQVSAAKRRKVSVFAQTDDLEFADKDIQTEEESPKENQSPWEKVASELDLSEDDIFECSEIARKRQQLQELSELTSQVDPDEAKQRISNKSGDNFIFKKPFQNKKTQPEKREAGKTGEASLIPVVRTTNEAKCDSRLKRSDIKPEKALQEKPTYKQREKSLPEKTTPGREEQIRHQSDEEVMAEVRSICKAPLPMETVEVVRPEELVKVCLADGKFVSEVQNILKRPVSLSKVAGDTPQVKKSQPEISANFSTRPSSLMQGLKESPKPEIMTPVTSANVPSEFQNITKTPHIRAQCPKEGTVNAKLIQLFGSQSSPVSEIQNPSGIAEHPKPVAEPSQNNQERTSSDTSKLGSKSRSDEAVLAEIESILKSSQDADCLLADPDLPDTVPANPDWEECRTTQGKPFYVHSVSGFTRFEPAASSTKNSFQLQDVEMDKEISNIPGLAMNEAKEIQGVLSESCFDHLGSVKWMDGDKDGRREVGSILESAKKRIWSNEQILSAKMSKKDANFEKLFTSFVFDKVQLADVQVVGQLDKKFLVTLLTESKSNGKGKVVCLFDQHAVDERVTLERLLAKYWKNGVCDCERLEQPMIITVSAAAVNVAIAEKPMFAKNGLSVFPHSDTALLIKAVPACFLRRQDREMKAYKESSLRRIVGDLVSDLTNHAQETRGAGLTIPKTIMDVIASEACRSAIKFNKELTLEEMDVMLKQLSLCQLPFQCAHGRPSIAPVFQMPDYRSMLMTEPKKLQLGKFKKKQ